MMSSLMCSDGLLQQHFLLSAVAAVKCQITAGAKVFSDCALIVQCGYSESTAAQEELSQLKLTIKHSHHKVRFSLGTLLSIQSIKLIQKNCVNWELASQVNKYE